MLTVVNRNVLLWLLPSMCAAETLWIPSDTCAIFGPPQHKTFDLTAIATILTAAVSLFVAWKYFATGEKYVPRSGYYNFIAACITTTVAGLCGYVSDGGCAKYRTLGVLKEIILAAVSRAAFETMDILSVLVSIAAVPFVIVAVAGNWWALLIPTNFTLLLCSVAYILLWTLTVSKQAVSAGSIGSSGPRFLSKLTMFVMAVYSLRFGSLSRNPVQIALQVVPAGPMILEGVGQLLLLLKAYGYTG
jgi:hypothetical protein